MLGVTGNKKGLHTRKPTTPESQRGPHTSLSQGSGGLVTEAALGYL